MKETPPEIRVKRKVVAAKLRHGQLLLHTGKYYPDGTPQVTLAAQQALDYSSGQMPPNGFTVREVAYGIEVPHETLAVRS